MSSSTAASHAAGSGHEPEQQRSLASIQPHGLLLVVHEPRLRIVQASTSAGALLGRPLDTLLLAGVRELGGDLEARLRELLAAGGDLAEPQPLQCLLPRGPRSLRFGGAVHRTGPGLLMVELEPSQPGPAACDPGAQLVDILARAAHRCSEAPDIAALCEIAVAACRDLFGYDRSVACEFDAAGQARVVAEARAAAPVLASLAGLHYRAGELAPHAGRRHDRPRVRVLADVDAPRSELLPRLLPGGRGEPSDETDLSRCTLRSAGAAQLQALREMGVAASLSIAIVRNQRLWGLLVCQHPLPRVPGPQCRAAAELLAEVIATRIAALESRELAQGAAQVRRLEQRLLEATSAEGDWRLALLRHPPSLLQPLNASGALLVHDGEILSCGEVPALPALRLLVQWLERQPGNEPLACAALARAEPALAAALPLACGALAVRLSTAGDHLVWLRKEAITHIAWAAAPRPLGLRLDAVALGGPVGAVGWTETVRGAAAAWTAGEVALAAAFGRTLSDIMVQVDAVRMLIAQSQLAQLREQMARSREAVVVADTAQQAFFANDAFCALAGRDRDALRSLDALLACFDDPARAHRMLGQVRAEQRSWHGELTLARATGAALPVAVHAEPVPARNGALLGIILVFEDLTPARRAEAARQQLDAALARADRGPRDDPAAQLAGAIAVNAGVAAMDITEVDATPGVAALLHEVEASATRAAQLLEQIRIYGGAES